MALQALHLASHASKMDNQIAWRMYDKAFCTPANKEFKEFERE
jgi:hypothetical protein